MLWESYGCPRWWHQLAKHCTRMVLMKIVILCCSVTYVVTDSLRCSDYLVSGLHGVEDSALSASSTAPTEMHSHYPKTARLFYPGDQFSTPKKAGAWVTDQLTTTQFIQVDFPADTTITSITVQGRFDYDQWIKRYYVMFSVDGFTWSTVESPNGSPLLFNGNVDRNTLVTSQLSPNITARHLRINPQSWNTFISLRFDVSGCQMQTHDGGLGEWTKFVKTSVTPANEMVDANTAVTTIPQVTFIKCAVLCHTHKTCVAFSFRSVDEIQWCTGYDAWIVAPGALLLFIKQDILDYMDGYKEAQGGAILYDVIEVRRDQSDASAACATQGTRLMKVDSASKMTSLMNVITGRPALSHDFRFYVSGVYDSQTSSYVDGIAMTSTLWSPTNPDPTQGHCTMLTGTGLVSVDCQQRLYSICGN